MGLFGTLNKMSGYSEENMIKSFNEILPAIGSKALCPIGVSFKVKTLLSSKPTGSGFVTLTDTNHLVIYTVIPFKSAAIYNFHSPKKLSIKDTVANQKIISAKLFNLRSQEFDDLLFQTGSKIDGFPHQAEHFANFISTLQQFVTE